MTSTSTLRRDITRFGSAIALTVALGAVQVLVLPHRLDVETFGEYRILLVYFPYFGLLHLGLADGAFLRWAGRRPDEIHREWRTTFSWMLGLESGLLIVAVLTASAMTQTLGAIFVVSFVLCAMFANVSTLAAYALQASGDFKRAGIVAVAAPASFVAVVLLVPMHTLTAVIASYAASLGFSALIGSSMVALLPASAASSQNDSLSPLPLVRSGAHVLGANLAAGLAQSIDKILVSVVASTASMALYGFASSVAVAGISATQTMQRVALSHAARRSADDRARFLGRFYDLTLAAYGAALVLVPLFEHIVATRLPVYTAALPTVRAFVAGAPFWIALHVVVVGTLQSHGLERRQFAVELGGAALVAIACGVGLAVHAELWVVAAIASAAAVVTWGAGVLVVNRAVPAARSQGAGRFLAACAWQSAACAVAIASGAAWGTQAAIYAVIAAVPTLAAIRRARGTA